MTEIYPLVSAIALAGREQVPDILRCIECFKKQTYSHKELLIINNASSQLEASDLNLKAEKDVFLIDTPTEMSAGMARAQGMSAANGQIIAQFDIDWWHAPERLETQIKMMAQQSAHISVLASTLSYSYVSGKSRYLGNDKNAILGTMIHLRQNKFNYDPNNEKQEELVLMENLINGGYKVVSLSIPELCCKLHFTSEARIDEPINDSLDGEHFEIIKKIV